MRVLSLHATSMRACRQVCVSGALAAKSAVGACERVSERGVRMQVRERGCACELQALTTACMHWGRVDWQGKYTAHSPPLSAQMVGFLLHRLSNESC